MSSRRRFPILVCLLAVLARGDELEDALSSRQAALSSFEAEYDALDRRVPSDGALRAALEPASVERRALRSLLSEAQDGASALSSAKFKVDFLRREWESAQREAQRISAAKDARYEELISGARSAREITAVDLRTRDPELEAWRARQATQFAQYKAFADEIEPLMRTYQLPDEQAAYDHAVALQTQRDSMRDAYEAERGRFNTAIEVWNSDQQAMEDEWMRRLAEIEEFVKEDGRRTLEATQLASKKEREFHEAEGKYAALSTSEQAALDAFDGRFQVAVAALRSVAELDTIRTAVSGASAGAGTATPYATRSSAEDAQAVAPPPVADRRPSDVRGHVFVLPPAASTAGVDAPPADVQRRAAALTAEAIAAQFQPAALETAATSDVRSLAADPSPGLPVLSASAPAVFLGSAPLSGGGADDDGSAVVVLDDDALTRAFHPGIFISDADYRRACAALERNAEWIPKLERQLARMRDQRGNLSGDAREFDSLRREIALGATREVLGVYATRLDMLLKNQRFAAALSTLQRQRLETAKRAFDTLKLGLVVPHADASGGARDADNLRREAWEEGAAALAELAGSQVGGEWAGRLFEQGGNLLKAGGKLTRELQDPKFGERPWPEELGQNLKTGIEIVGTWCPPVALGVGLEALGERGLQWAITQDAVDSLSASVKTTDDAIVYLADRLQRAQELNDEAERIVRDHDGASAARRRGFQGGS